MIFNILLGLSWESMLSDAQIVFPDDQKEVPSCRGSTFCEKVDSYPEDVVNIAIQRNESIKYLATVDIVSLFFSYIKSFLIFV